jgi:hypothetical protein
MTDPASSGRRRVGLAQFQRDMERATAYHRREMERSTAPLRMIDEASRRIARIVEGAATTPSRLIAELIGDSAVFSPPRRQKAIPAAVEAPRPDPARPPRSASRRKPKKPRGKTAEQRLKELWDTDEGRGWLIVEAPSVEEVARRIGKGLTQTKGNKLWREEIAPARKAYPKLLKLERWERDQRRAC